MNNFNQIIQQYKNDSESVYNTWFVENDQRLKAFRTIRRGIIQVVEDIKNKSFPNDFKNSSLEFVGEVILSGSQSALVPVADGDELVCTVGGLGSCRVKFSGRSAA